MVRKLNGKGNLVPPIDFIPELEQNGLICFVDFFVLETVCEYIHNWQKHGKKFIKVSVNMSRTTYEKECRAEGGGYLQQVSDRAADDRDRNYRKYRRTGEKINYQADG